jgi:DNA helicase IV
MGTVFDEFLLDILESKRQKGEVTDIVETIQKNQNDIVTLPSNNNIIVQGCAGCGKTMILLHRLDYFEYKKIDLKAVLVILPNRGLIDSLDTIINKTLYIKNANYMSVTEYYIRNILSYKINLPIVSKIQKMQKNITAYEKDIPVTNDNYYFDKNLLWSINNSYDTLSRAYINKGYDIIKKQQLQSANRKEDVQKIEKLYDKIRVNEKIKQAQALFDIFYKYRDMNKGKFLTRGELFIYSYIMRIVFGPSPLLSNISYCFIDEAQNITREELKLIRDNKPTVLFNLFGDLKQKFEKSIGLNSWEEIIPMIGNAKQFLLNENYRSSLEITNYVNDKLHIVPAITAIGRKNEPVKENIKINDLHQIISAKINEQPNIRIAIIISAANERCEYADLKEDKEFQQYLKYTDEIKGQEFGCVFVIPFGMSYNEKYVAFTRALNNLYIIDKFELNMLYPTKCESNALLHY